MSIWAVQHKTHFCQASSVCSAQSLDWSCQQNRKSQEKTVLVWNMSIMFDYVIRIVDYICFSLCLLINVLFSHISHLPFCVLDLFICCTHACNCPLLKETIHYTVEQLNWQMQSTTLLCPTSPSCLLFAPAITNLFSLSPNPHTSPFILHPLSLISPPLNLPLPFYPTLPFFFFFPLSVPLIHLPPQHLPLFSHFSPIFISISLSVRGRGGRVSFRGDSFRETCQTHTYTHTRAVYVLSPWWSAVWWAAAKLDVIKCNWWSVWGKLEKSVMESRVGGRDWG